MRLMWLEGGKEAKASKWNESTSSLNRVRSLGERVDGRRKPDLSDYKRKLFGLRTPSNECFMVATKSSARNKSEEAFSLRLGRSEFN
jgi:hypothetical protein